MCYSVQLIIHFASGKALGKIASAWSGGCCLAEGQGEDTVQEPPMETTLCLWLPGAQTETSDGTGLKGTSGYWLFSLLVSCLLQPWKCWWRRLADGIRKAALGLDGVTWMCDLIMGMPPCGSSCWMGAAQSVCYALGGTEDPAQLWGDWMIPWVPPPALNNEQTWVSVVSAARSVRSSGLPPASPSTWDWKQHETKQLATILCKGAPRAAQNSREALVMVGQETEEFLSLQFSMTWKFASDSCT